MINIKLIELRKEKGMSQQNVADKSGISRSAYSSYENGTRNPRVKTAKRILKVLGEKDKTVDYFF